MFISSICVNSFNMKPKYTISSIIETRVLQGLDHKRSLIDELASACGITRNAFHQYLRIKAGEPRSIPSDNLFLIAKRLEVSIEELFNVEPVPATAQPIS